jgi:N-acyl-D-amino-acid deacylase
VTTIEVTPSSPSVFEDGALQLTARTLAADGSVVTGRTVTWTSSNTAVATVNANGAVSARDPGTATLTAAAEGRSAQVTLTVLHSGTAQVRLSVSRVFVGTGDTMAVGAEAIDSAGRVLRNRAFTWYTAAPVATVTGGVVTGVQEGTTTLTATSDGVDGTVAVDVFTVRGRQVDIFAGVDTALVGYLRRNGIPGGILAVAREGRLVYARGYGMADLTADRPMEPDLVVNWGSVSKTVTGLAVLKLREQGIVSPGDLPFQTIPGLSPLPAETMDPRITGITLQNLLDHAGGWDNNRRVDDRVWQSVWQLGETTQAGMIRYGLGVPLDHEPGTVYAYSNYATQVVGEYVAAVTGQPYEAWVTMNVFAPLGITGAHFSADDPAQQIGHPTYYLDSETPIIEPIPQQLYTGASGAWAGTVLDLLRLINGIEGLNGPALFQPATLDQLIARSTTWPATGQYYTNFMSFLPGPHGLDWWHSGLPRGGYAEFWRRGDGTTWVLSLNRSPPAANPDLRAIMATISAWPGHDLFADFN